MIKVAEHIFRGPRPSDMRILRDLGIERIINLQSGVYELLHDDLYESQGGEHGIVEYDCGLSDFSPPDRKVVAKALEILKDTSSKVYVHCKHGVDRTGFVIAAYRMAVEGWNYEAARDEMFARGFHKFPYVLWLPELQTYEEDY